MPVEILKKLPAKARQLWESTYSAAKEQYGEERAGKIAWAAVKKRFKKVEDKWVAKFIVPQEYTSVKYVFAADSDAVSKSDDGFFYRDYVLSSNGVDKHGQSFSDFALKRMVDQINEEQVVGRYEGDKHVLWKQLSEKGLSPQEIEEELQKIDTGIKAVAARYENGKVVARIRFAPEVYEQVKDLKGASVEARLPSSSYRAGVFHQARLQGFVLTNQPANPDAIAL